MTNRYEGGLCYGLADTNVLIQGLAAEVSFYFEIDVKNGVVNNYSDGKVTVAENMVAGFEYKRTGSLVISSRYVDNIGAYASAIEGAIKEFERYKLNE